MLGLTRKDWLNILPVLALSGLLATFRSGATGLIDPDEPFYALTAKEMLEKGEWVTPTLFGQPQFEKPVFSYWVYRAFFGIFGVHEWSARLGPALAALGTLIASAALARALFGRARTVLVSAVILATGGLFITLSRVVLTDMFLCFFVTASFAAFAAGWKNRTSRPAAWRFFFVFMALGTLTKGPLGVLLPLGSVFLFDRFAGRGELLKQLPWKSGLALFAAVAVPWYAAAAVRNDWFLGHFFLHENVRRFFVAEHRSMNTPHFYPIVFLFGFFPWSAVLLAAAGSQLARLGRGAPAGRQARAFLVVSASAMFLFFSCASSKLISYIFPIFPLAAVLTADWLDRLAPALARRASVPPGLRLMAVAGWGILPASLVGGVYWYAHDHGMGMEREILIAGLTAVLPAAAACVLFLRRLFWPSIAVAAAMSAVFSLTAFGWFLPMTERFFSSRSIMADFARQGADPSAGMLLGSKISVRGISYYSGNANVAVVSTKAHRTFYTPHPIPVISAPEDLRFIRESDYPVYGVLRPKDIGRLREIMGPGRGLHILESNAQRAIVRLERR